MWHMLPDYVAAHLLAEQLYFQVSQVCVQGHAHSSLLSSTANALLLSNKHNA
jgi:hypothetical protein